SRRRHTSFDCDWSSDVCSSDLIEGAEPKIGDALVNGQPGVLLTLSSQPGANTLEVTQALETALDEFKPLLARSGIQFAPAIHRQIGRASCRERQKNSAADVTIQ